MDTKLQKKKKNQFVKNVSPNVGLYWPFISPVINIMINTPV